MFLQSIDWLIEDFYLTSSYSLHRQQSLIEIRNSPVHFLSESRTPQSQQCFIIRPCRVIDEFTSGETTSKWLEWVDFVHWQYLEPYYRTFLVIFWFATEWSLLCMHQFPEKTLCCEREYCRKWCTLYSLRTRKRAEYREMDRAGESPSLGRILSCQSMWRLRILPSLFRYNISLLCLYRYSMFNDMSPTNSTDTKIWKQFLITIRDDQHEPV